MERKGGRISGGCFPESIPTHSKIQEYHIDMTSSKLIQHNYTVDTA